MIAAGQRPIAVATVGLQIGIVVDRGVAVAVRRDQERHVAIAGGRIDDLWIAVGVGKLDRFRPGGEDRHRRRAQARKVWDVEIGQIGVDRVDQRRIERHRHLQVGQRAVALEVRHRRRGRAHRGVAEIFRAIAVDVEVHLVDVAGGAVGEGERAGRDDGVAGIGVVGLRGRGEIDRGDAGLLQRFKLSRIDGAVAVGIDPDAQLRIDRIVGVDHAVAVGIVLRQRRKALGARPAEHFRDIGRAVLARLLQHQHAVVGLDPAGIDGKAGAQHVEHRRYRAHRREIDAPSGEIEHQRVDVEELQPGLGVEDVLADLEDVVDIGDERPLQVEQLLRRALAQADENAVGLGRKGNAGAALITRDVGVVAEQILDDQIALLIEAVFRAIRPDDPRVRRADLPDRALDKNAAWREYLVVRRGTIDQFII